MTTRTCSECGQAYRPALQRQVRCIGCARAPRDIAAIDQHMQHVPSETFTGVAVATGIAEETVRRLAAQGRLAAEPIEADDVVPARCSCPPGDSGRCPVCRTRLAREFREARYDAVKAPARQSGVYIIRR